MMDIRTQNTKKQYQGCQGLVSWFPLFPLQLPPPHQSRAPQSSATACFPAMSARVAAGLLLCLGVAQDRPQMKKP